MMRGTGTAIGRPVLLLAVLVLGLYDAAYIAKWLWDRPQPPFGDFFAFWTFGRFAAAHGSAIYNPYLLTAYQRGLDPAFAGSYPFMYPPTLLLLLEPLMRLPFTAAYLAWVGLGLAVFVLGTLGRGWRSLAGAALLVAPSTLLAVISGQNGLITAGLLAGGLRWLKPRPLLAGVFLGLLTYKPQFALVVPVVLLASRNWRAMGACLATGLAAILASTVLLARDLWPAWIASMPVHQHLMVINRPPLEHLTPGIMAGMKLVGGPDALAIALQLAVSAALVLTLWRAFSRDRGAPAIAFAMLCAVLLAPYVQIYDSPIIASAVAICWVARARAGGTVRVPEAALVASLLAVLCDMITTSIPFVAAALLLAFSVLMAREALRPAGVSSDLEGTGMKALRPV